MDYSPVSHSRSSRVLNVTLDEYYTPLASHAPWRKGACVTAGQMCAALSIENHREAHSNAAHYVKERAQVVAGLTLGAVSVYPVFLLIVGLPIGWKVATLAYVLTMGAVVLALFTPLGFPLIQATASVSLSPRQSAVQRQRCLRNLRTQATIIESDGELHTLARRIYRMSSNPSFSLWQDYEKAAREILGLNSQLKNDQDADRSGLQMKRILDDLDRKITATHPSVHALETQEV